MPIIYTNERMADLFKDPRVAAFKRPRNLKNMVERARLDNPLLNGGFKICSDARFLLCKHNTNAAILSPITGRTLSVAKFALSNTLMKEVTSAEGSITTALQ